MYTLGTFFKDTINSTNAAIITKPYAAAPHIGAQDYLWCF
jgi:hypothetical protein